MDALFFLCIVDRNMFQRPARELVGAVPILDFALETAHHDSAELRWLGRDAACESLVIQKLQQRRETLFISVVRSGGEEEFVLKVLADFAQGLGSLRVESEIAGATRCGIVRFIHDQDIEVAQAWTGSVMGHRLTEHTQRLLALQRVYRGNKAREM